LDGDRWLAIAWPSSMNCLLYARISTDKQAQKGLSIPAQLDMMAQHARTDGWKVVGRSWGIALTDRFRDFVRGERILVESWGAALERMKRKFT
jgi:hypothetical protein